RLRSSARSSGRGSAAPAPANIVVPVAARSSLSAQQGNLDQGAHNVACQSEARAYGATLGVRGDVACVASSAGTDRAAGAGDPCSGAGLVAGRGGDGADGDAGHRSDLGDRVPGGGRRSFALSNAARVDGLSGLGAVGELDRRYDPARSDHEGRQPPGAPHAGRVLLELSASTTSGKG